MRNTTEDVDPWKSADPALAVALGELDWYRRAAGRARNANRISEVLLLVMSAATTVAAALAATAWLTATLAAGSLILTGLRKSFDWHDRWVSFTARWSELRPVIHQYRLRSDDHRDEETQRMLLATVDDIVGNETEKWASRRRKMADHSQEDAP